VDQQVLQIRTELEQVVQTMQLYLSIEMWFSRAFRESGKRTHEL
jgi:hypothetical protein